MTGASLQQYPEAIRSLRKGELHKTRCRLDMPLIAGFLPILAEKVKVEGGTPLQS